MQKKGISILGILLVIGLAVMVSGCTSSTPDNSSIATAPNTSTTPASTTTSTSSADISSQGANINPVDGSTGVYMGVFSGFPGYRSSDSTILWVCDKKDHIKMWGYMSDYEANGNTWKDSDLHTVTWNG